MSAANVKVSFIITLLKSQITTFTVFTVSNRIRTVHISWVQNIH